MDGSVLFRRVIPMFNQILGQLGLVSRYSNTMQQDNNDHLFCLSYGLSLRPHNSDHAHPTCMSRTLKPNSMLD